MMIMMTKDGCGDMDLQPKLEPALAHTFELPR